ncbi:hypothetical protein [Deinococcus altitudinis]|uniref:hypothetical protein n=1 Tax=Deinococcus altitudinis TaxID=468914 RepID=UPI00389210D1
MLFARTKTPTALISASLILLLCSYAMADWQRYTPDALPPLVQEVYPGQQVQLAQAQQGGPDTPANNRAQLDTLIRTWIGENARWYVRLNGDSSEALVVSSSGLHAVAVRLTVTEPQGALVFSLTLKSPLTPARSFIPATEEALWTRTVPVTANPFSTLPCPEGIELGSTGITVTSPANFPLPAGKKQVQELRCQNLEVLYRGGGQYRLAEQITVRAPTWQQAWSRVADTSMLRLLLSGTLSVVNNTVTVKPPSSGSTFCASDVVAVQLGQALLPLLFQKKLTPYLLGSGENRIYLNDSVGFSAWDFVSIDTRAGVVVLIRSMAFPK